MTACTFPQVGANGVIEDVTDVWADITEPASPDVQSVVADFPDVMESLITDIRALTEDPVGAYTAAQPEVRDLAAPLTPGDPSWMGGGANPYFEGEAEAIRRDPWTPVPLLFGYTRFRNDMNMLADRLADFLDRSDPSRFYDIVTYLREAEDLLRRAQGSNGLDLVEASLQGWDGEAATNFRHVFYGQFNEVVEGQAKLLRSVGLAALAYQQILVHAQADSLDIATQVKSKLAPATEALDLGLGTLLLVVGVVAGGVAAAGSGWGIIAWAAGTSTLVLDGIEEHAAAGPAEERVVKGGMAMDFIPSAHSVLNRLWRAINNEESMLRDGVRSNNVELEGSIKGSVEPREPELAGSSRRGDLGTRSNVAQYDIEELLRCARGWLPAMAEMFHQAYLQLVLAKGHLHSMLGARGVVGSQRTALDEAFELLMTAVVKTRDHLYRCGENLSTIAGNYYDNEERNAEIARKIDTWLAEDFDLDLYQPRSGRGRGGSNYARPV